MLSGGGRVTLKEKAIMAELTRDEKKQLLESADVFKWLPAKKLIKLMWWELFNKKKIATFYDGLKVGKSALFAYNYADNS